MRDDAGDDGEEEEAVTQGAEQPSFGPRDPQPYLPREAQFYSTREQQNFPREQQSSPRENPSRENLTRENLTRENPSREQNHAREPQGYPRDQSSFQREQREPREQPGYAARHSPNQASRGAEEDGNVERLPSFITGGAATPSAPPPQSHQSYGQNGFEGQGDRFPLHRRRRRHRGPARSDPAQGGQAVSEGDEAPQGPRPNGE